MASHPSTPGLVTIKLASLKTPSSGRALSSNSGGVWLDSLELASSIQRELAGVGHAAVPQQKQFLQGRKVVFVPYAQIEWMIAEAPF
jgi:hypothetical protein